MTESQPIIPTWRQFRARAGNRPDADTQQPKGDERRRTQPRTKGSSPPGTLTVTGPPSNAEERRPDLPADVRRHVLEVGRGEAVHGEDGEDGSGPAQRPRPGVFRATAGVVLRIRTDRGTEFCGRYDEHPIMSAVSGRQRHRSHEDEGEEPADKRHLRTVPQGGAAGVLPGGLPQAPVCEPGAAAGPASMTAWSPFPGDLQGSRTVPPPCLCAAFVLVGASVCSCPRRPSFPVYAGSVRGPHRAWSPTHGSSPLLRAAP